METTWGTTWRRSIAALIAAIIAVTAFAGSTIAGAADDDAIPTTGALWGSSSQWIKNYPLEDRVADLESQLGSDLQALRLYHFWSEGFPTAHEEFLVERDILPVLSVDTRDADGSRVSWPAVAAAQPGDAVYENIVRWADDLKAWGRPILVSLNHEPDYYRNGGNGKAADYVAAYRRFFEILDAEGADNVHTMWIGVAWNWNKWSDTPIAPWYPGDDVVDYAGADAYSWNGCNAPHTKHRSFEKMFQDVRDWGVGRDVRLMVGEFGSVEDATDPKAKGDWFRAAADTLAQPDWEQFDVVLYWNRTHESALKCHFRMDTSAYSLQGAADLAAAPVFRNRSIADTTVTVPTAPAPTVPAPTTTVPAPTTTTTAPTTTAPAPTTTAPTTTTAAPTTTAPAPTTTTTAPSTGTARTASTSTEKARGAIKAGECEWDPTRHELDASAVEILTASSITNPNA